MGIGRTAASNFLANRVRGKPTEVENYEEDERKEREEEERRRATAAAAEAEAIAEAERNRPVNRAAVLIGAQGKNKSSLQAAAQQRDDPTGDDVFVHTLNPIAEENKKKAAARGGKKGKAEPRVRKYERPDPSKK